MELVRPAANELVVTLGDYVDRGPDSKEEPKYPRDKPVAFCSDEEADVAAKMGFSILGNGKMEDDAKICDELRERCLSGIRHRYSQDEFQQAVLRLDRELALIRTSGKAENFLVAATVAEFARSRQIGYRLVGAGCGSIVAYVLRLSDTDPLRHGLLFERFCGPKRPWAGRFLLRVEPGRKEELLGLADRTFGAVLVDRAILLSDLTVEEMIPQLVAASIGEQRGAEGDLGKIPVDDADAFALLWSGRTEGIFQLDSDVLRRWFARIRPKGVGDVAALTAILACGPARRNVLRRFIGRKELREYPETVRHDLLQLLGESRGMLLYQEQVMNLLAWFGEIPLADGYRFVKAAAGGRREVVDEFRLRFCCHAARDGMEETAAKALFDRVAEAAAYARCKAHEFANAVLTCRAAWLKVHHPAEFERVVRTSMVPDLR